MDDVISLAERRAARAAATGPPVRPRVSFFFDLASPWTYLAAERVDRIFSGVRWQPAFGNALRSASTKLAPENEIGRRAAESRAEQLAMPLVWPETRPDAGYTAMRVAALAAERDCAASFVLAASRLAFCGGFDVNDPEILAEAAAAAGLGLEESLAAAADRSRDVAMHQTAVWLLSRGGSEIPALAVGRTLYCGEHRLVEAAAAITSRRVRRTRRLPTFGA
jgi:2-hydroxychromene-2-carboxylate isomerase